MTPKFRTSKTVTTVQNVLLELQLSAQQHGHLQTVVSSMAQAKVTSATRTAWPANLGLHQTFSPTKGEATLLGEEAGACCTHTRPAFGRCPS